MENKLKHNHLAAAEMGEEQNYNNIDGIINNVQKPSILEQMKEYQEKIADSATVKSEKPAEIQR